MGEIIQLNSKPKRNLYIVDNYRVILAHSSEEAHAYVKQLDEKEDLMEVRIIEDHKELNVIKSGKVEVVLWEREPKPLERLSFKLKVRDFIDQYLKNYSIPSSQDIIEDKGTIRPKK